MKKSTQRRSDRRLAAFALGVLAAGFVACAGPPAPRPRCCCWLCGGAVRALPIMMGRSVTPQTLIEPSAVLLTWKDAGLMLRFDIMADRKSSAELEYDTMSCFNSQEYQSKNNDVTV